MTCTKKFSIIAIAISILLIFVISIRSPNEQSLQENLDPFNFFESSSKAKFFIDDLIQILVVLYFSLALLYNIKIYF